MAISEQLVIEAKLDLSGVAGDIDKLRSQLDGAISGIKPEINFGIAGAIADLEKFQAIADSIKIPVFGVGGEDSSKLAEASLKKLQLEVDSLEAKKAAAAQKDLEREAQLDSKREANSQKEAQRESDAIAKKEANAQKILQQLEKQEAASNVKVAQGNQNGNDSEQRAAIQAAKIYQESIRYKQQLAQIQGAFFSDGDRAKAEAFAASINKINVDKINKDFAQTNVGTRTFIGNLADASTQIGFFAEKLNALKGNAQSAFLELDVARKKLSTISTDANGLVKELSNVAAANKFQATTAELAGAAYEVQSAGFIKTADTAKILDASLKGAVGGFSDITTVSKATISVLNAYGLGADKAASIVDKFTAVQQSGLITVDQYASQISRIAPVSAAAGVSLDQLNGFIATSTAAGVPVESTFAGLRQALASTIKPSGDAAKEAERLGIQFDATALRTRGLNGILADVKNSGKATGDTFSKLFGSIEAVAAIQPAINNLKALDDNIKASSNSSGLAKQNFDKVASTIKGFANESQEALALLGEKINQQGTAFNPFLGATRNVVTAFRQLPPEAQNVVAAIVGLGATFVALTAGYTGFLAAATPALGALKGLAGSLSSAATSSISFSGAIEGVKSKFQGVDGQASAAATNIKNVGIALGTALLAGLAFEVVKDVFDTISTAARGTSEATKGLKSDYEEYLRLLKEPIPDQQKPKPADDFKNQFQSKLNPLEAFGDSINDAGNKVFGAKKEGDFLYARTNKDVKSEQSSIDFAAQITESDTAARKVIEIQAKIQQQIQSGQKLTQKESEESKRKIDATSKSIQDNINRIQAIEAIGDTQKSAKSAQLNYLDSLSAKQKKLTEAKVETAKTDAIAESVNKKQIEEAKRITGDRNTDSERGIKRVEQDEKSKRDLENAKVLADIQEKNELKKSALNQKQQEQTDALKEKNAIALKDKERIFDDAQATKKLEREQQIEDKKKAFDEKSRQLTQAFDDRQNALKEQRAEAQRKADEAFANARSERDKKNNEASTGAKNLIETEGKIATAKPEEKAKVAAQAQEENRIRNEAKTQGIGGEQTQEQLVAKAKQIAQVSAITTAEEQKKVQLALDELEKANKAKQAELDKVEDKKRAEEKRIADKAFEQEQKAEKRLFEEDLKKETLAFERDILKPEKLKLEQELKSDKLAFERGELAALKKQQAAEERTLKQQQEVEDRQLKKAADAELDALKATQKVADLAIDRANEDAKIERERAFKESQRALDKASATEIQAILGKSTKELFDAIGALSNAKLGAIAGIGSAKNNVVPTDKVPAFANGGVSNGGIALVGERGAELVDLPRGASVTPANDTRSLLSKSGDNSRVEALLERLIGSVNRPNLAIQTSDDPATIAANIYRNMAVQEAQRSGI